MEGGRESVSAHAGKLFLMILVGKIMMGRMVVQNVTCFLLTSFQWISMSRLSTGEEPIKINVLQTKVLEHLCCYLGRFLCPFMPNVPRLHLIEAVLIELSDNVFRYPYMQ